MKDIGLKLTEKSPKYNLKVSILPILVTLNSESGVFYSTAFVRILLKFVMHVTNKQFWDKFDNS